MSVLRTDLVLQLLLADESNPRSVAFQLDAVVRQFDDLGEPDDTEHRRLEGLASKALGEVCVALTEELAQRDGEGRFAALESLLDQLKTDLYEFAEALMAQYMSPAKPSRLTSSW